MTLSGMTNRVQTRHSTLGLVVCLLLASGALAAYWPVLRCEFLNYDDPTYVTDNPAVQSGLTWRGLAWAFTSAHGANWHPVTWLSHMLDCQLFGLHPAGHHLVNLLLHLANTLLLFGLFRKLTRAFWPSVFVAALFGLHPLHVESVAWVAERKNLLSAFFFLLTLWAYARYVEQSKVQSPKSKVWYGLALLCFALGLMSKPMLVTLPFVLLLLDYWPLRRMSFSLGRTEQPSIHQSTAPLLHHSTTPPLRLVLEKLPFFALSALSCAVTVWAQRRGGAVMSVEDFPIGTRLANAAFAYGWYVQKTCWPSHLAVFYPHPHPRLTGLALAALIALIVVTAAASAARKRPYLTVGWLWFASTLVPVIGLVQVGMQGMADRYSYIPSIGLFILTGFGLNELAARFRHGRIPVAVLACLILPGCLVATHFQVLHWRDSETLFRHALRVTQGNYAAYNNLGIVLDSQGKTDQAIACYNESLRFKPDQEMAHNNLANALMTQGHLDEAEIHLRQALKCNPKAAVAQCSLARLWQLRGDTDAAVAACRRALALDPGLPEAHNNLGCLLAAQGKSQEALAHFQRALGSRPELTEALNNLGRTLTDQGRAAQAVSPLRTAIQLKPDFADAHYHLGNAWSVLKKRPEALAEYQIALRLNPTNAWAHYKMGNVYLAEGNAEAAAEQYRAALSLDPNLAEAHYHLALVLLARKQVDQGIQQYRQAVRLKPDWVEALNNLAWLLATHADARFRSGGEALRLAQHAAELTRHEDAETLDTLAAAQAEAGNFPEAVATARRAIDLANRNSKTNLALAISNHLELYQRGLPRREP